MKIPKIIHQTWKNNTVPAHFSAAVESWKNFHQDWEYVLWTDEMNMAFIETHFSEFIDTYRGYKSNIQRVDAVRYFILYHLGGLYIDLDFHCFRNISPLISDADCVFGLEHAAHASIHKKDRIISNAIMAGRPNAGFMKLVCDELFNPKVRACKDSNELILETTGPFMLTRVYEKNSHNDSLGIQIIESQYLYPLHKDEIDEQLLNNLKKRKVDEKLKNAYGLHYYWGSWWG